MKHDYVPLYLGFKTPMAAINQAHNEDLLFLRFSLWLHRKKRLAEGKLGRSATAEEIILEYKGLLKSKSDEKKRALQNFKDNYDQLKNK
jgi:hypothetical protein